LTLMKHTQTRLCIVIAAFTLLNACATKPLPHVQIQYVDRPVAVACIDKGDLPAEPAPIGALPGDARQAADLLAAKVMDYKAGWREWLALAGPCTRAP